MEDPRPNYTALVKLGFSANIADALDGRGVRAEDVKYMGAEETLDHFLTWKGVIGFTRTLMEAVDECREVHKCVNGLN